MPKRRYRTSSWKKLQLSAKLHRRLKILALAVVVVVSTLVVSGAVALYQFFTQPMAAAVGASGSDVVFSGEGFNLLLISLEAVEDPTSLIRELSVIRFYPEGKRVVVVELPLEAEVGVPQGFGINRLATVYALGALAKPEANLNLTAQTVSRLLAIPIDGYLLTDTFGLSTLARFRLSFETLKLLPSFWAGLRSDVRTNLSFPSLLALGKTFFESQAQMEVFRISKEELADEAHLDLDLKRYFTDPKIVEGRLKIQILNGTEKPGLAGHVSRYVKNLGGEVIVLSNFERTDLAESFLVTSQTESYTAQALARVLQVDNVRSEFPGVGERADLTIIVGLDSFRNL